MSQKIQQRVSTRQTPERSSKKEPVQREVSAGGIVFRKVGNTISFAVMKDSYGKWTFPKGHVELGEDLEEAADMLAER